MPDGGGKVDVPGIGPWHLNKLQDQMEADFLALIHKDHNPRSPLTAVPEKGPLSGVKPPRPA